MAISIRTIRPAAVLAVGALASGGYVLTAVLAGGLTSRYGILMTAGLVFCLLVTSAAVLFYISDVFLANWRYVSTARWNMFVCYPLYYTACVLLAVSILFEINRE